MSEKKKHSPEQLAAQKAKESAHKELVEKLDVELEDMLKLHSAPEPVVQARKRIQEKIESALQASFGPKVGVESIGFDRFGLSIGQAPFELAIVHRDSDPLRLPSRENTLYHTSALIDVLNTHGIPTEVYSPPSWISPESASRPFALPEPAIINEAMGLVLVPPDPSHSIRMSLVEDCIRKFPPMRSVLGLLYIFAARDSDAILPPLTSRILSHLILAYCCHKYAISTLPNASSSPPIISFYSHPSSIVSPNVSNDSSNDTSSVKDAPIIVTASSPSDFPPSRKSQSTTAYDLLDLLGWWDQLRWDQHVIMSTSPLTLRRSFDNETNASRTWDWLHSPLILQDPIYPLNNLATLLTPTSYSELRTSFRSIRRSLCAGLGVPLARKQARLLHSPSAPSDTRSLSTSAGKDYGDRLTSSMLELYARSRPSWEVEKARRESIGRLRRILDRIYGPQYVPVLFGSSRYGVSDRQSDLDIVILDQNRPYGFTPNAPDSSLPAIYKLHNLATAMKRQYGRVLVIQAKVPIIKARDPATNLHIDININDRLGLFNTELLEYYCRLWPPLSNLIYVIKKWAKARGLNEPAGQRRGGPTFSSYCLTLMIVGFLQSHRVLPNLHASSPALGPDDRGETPHFWIKVTPKTRMKCWVDWNRLPVEEWKPVNNPSLGRAFYAWLHYFAYDHKYDEFAIRIEEGGIVPRHGKVKKSKATSETPPGKNQAPDQETLSDPLDTIEAKEAAMGIEVITDDVKPAQLVAAGREALAIQAEDAALEGSLTDDTFVRASRLEEPDRWKIQALVVSDPFITTKNCAANVSRNSVMDFKNHCKNSLEAIDDGMSLNWLLTGEPYLPSIDSNDAQEIIERRTNPPKGKKRGKNHHPDGGNAPQARGHQQQETLIVPKQKSDAA